MVNVPDPNKLKSCPMCNVDEREYDSFNMPKSFDCLRCGHCEFFVKDVAEGLADLPPWKLSAYARARYVLENPDGPLCLIGLTPADVERFAPATVNEKADHLLRMLVAQTKVFGDEIQPNDFSIPLGFAENWSEFRALLHLLSDRNMIDMEREDRLTLNCVVKGAGFDFVDKAPIKSQTIFISSTCYDLMDARAELAAALESDGHILRLSDDPERFDASGSTDSIEICLQNLRLCDFIVVLLDRRYGSPLKDSSRRPIYGGKSATHVEVEEAMKIGKPILTFVRDRSVRDFDAIQAHLKSGSETPAPTRWIQDDKLERQEAFLSLFRSLTALDKDKPNWYTTFQNAVDLKKLVRKALIDRLLRGTADSTS